MSLSVPQNGGFDEIELSDGGALYDAGADAGDDAGGDAMVRAERSPHQWLYFMPALLTATISMLAGGIPMLTDFAFIMVAVLCGVFLLTELRAFSFRWGIGGLLVYGGVLIWFCIDYFDYWFGASLIEPRKFDVISRETVARAGAIHILFIICLIFGLRIRLNGWGERILAKFPEPGNDKLYIALFIGLFLFGMSPYLFFTREGPVAAIWSDIVGGRGGGARWTVGRDGNVNYSYGAYLAQVQQVGTAGSILGAFYAICVARSVVGKLIGWLIWVPAALLAFGGGTRGAVVLVALPAMGFAFIRFQAAAAVLGRRVSWRAYAWLIGFLMAILLAVQVQATFRTGGFRDADLNEVKLTKVQGNQMFTESLKGFEMIPKTVEPFYAANPLEAIVRPIPDALYWAVVSPMPRAVWTDKPIDQVWRWYNYVVAGTRGNEGTTISQGAAGYWYFRYGVFGVVEGGLFIGFLMGVVERLLREHAPTKPILILVSLALATWLFRCFRGLQWVELHGTLVGFAALATMVIILRPLFGGGQQQQQADPA